MKTLTPERIQELRIMPYEEYLKTPEWQHKRELALERDEYHCRVCNCHENLHVHHRTYERRGNENLNDLTTLCNDCHEHFHRRIRLKDHMGSPDDVMQREKKKQEEKSKGSTYEWEHHLIGLLIPNPSLCPYVVGILAEEDFADTNLQELYRIYISVCQCDLLSSQPFEQFVPSELLPIMVSAIKSVEQQKHELPKSRVDEARLVTEAEKCIVGLKRMQLKQKLEGLNIRIREAAEIGDHDLERQLRKEGSVYQRSLRTIYISTSIQ